MAMSKLNAAYSKMSKLGGPEPKPKKHKNLDEVNLKSKSYFEGPFAKMKAKKAIRKGETEVAVAVKNPKNKRSLLNPEGTKSVTKFKDYMQNTPQKIKTTKTPYIAPMKKLLLATKHLEGANEDVKLRRIEHKLADHLEGTNEDVKQRRKQKGYINSKGETTIFKPQ